jgi:hypothetical protein
MRNAITFLMIVAANHYIVGMECPPECRMRMSPGAKLLMDLVSKANGNILVCPFYRNTYSPPTAPS